MLKKGLLFIVFIFLVFSLSVCKNIFSAASEPVANTLSRVFLPQTGQTTSYAAGDDGAYRSGAAWPNPRFVNNGDGTVTDRLTGLMWEQAPSATMRNWSDAIAYCDNMTLGGYTDWRLPNVNELRSLVNFGVSDPVVWLNTQGYTGVKGDYPHWSSTSNSSTYAFYVHFYSNPRIISDQKIGTHYVWGVRAGHSGAVRLPRTGQTTSYTAGDDGAYQSGAPWPNPRFVVNGNGTITDRLTGLMWEQAPSGTPSASWTAAFDRINTLNTTKLGGYSDWRLPNINEFYCLTNYGQSNVYLWLMSQGFVGLTSNSYWTNTTSAYETAKAWNKAFDGQVSNAQDKITTNTSYVIAVRGGQ